MTTASHPIASKIIGFMFLLLGLVGSDRTTENPTTPRVVVSDDQNGTL